jgi:hypothetical protein
MGVGIQIHALAALPPGKRPGTLCTGGQLGPRDGLDGWGKSRPSGIRSPYSPARSESKSLYSSSNSWYVLMFYIPCPTTGPYILINTFLSHAFSFFIAMSVSSHLSLQTLQSILILMKHQLDAQFVLYIFVSILYMFRAILCSSSGESIVSIQHLVCVSLCM